MILKMSSYSKNNFGDIIRSLAFSVNPNKIVEFGILNGYSLNSFICGSSSECQIYAYDIFEKFVGNGSNYNDILDKYKKYPNVKIKRGDFYEQYKNFDNESIDILHIDIANDGNIYQFCIDNYYSKLVKGGIIILEGGSKERDNVEWMIKYNKTPITNVINKLKSKYSIIVINKFPSMTIIRKK